MKSQNVVELFQQGNISPREYLEQCISVIREKEPLVQVFSHIDLDSARLQADASTLRYQQGQPLSDIDGIPVGIKDIIDTAFLPTGMGSEIYRDWQPMCNAEAVDALISDGAVVIGKTRSTEFAIGRATTTTNPHDYSRTPGGSSSGTAAGVASGMFFVGLGTQTQGSIIRPASYCGVIGYKPTWGVLSLRGVHPVSYSHDHLGIMAQDIDVVWSVASSIMKYRPTPESAKLISKPRLVTEFNALPRIAILRTEGYGELNTAELHAFEERIEQWQKCGVSVTERSDDNALAELCDELDAIPSDSAEMVAADMRWPYAHYCKVFPEKLGKKIIDMVDQSKSIRSERYSNLSLRRKALLIQIGILARKYDIFVLPSSSGVAKVGLENTGSRTLSVYASYLGLPAISLPMVEVDGLPMGIQVLGRPFYDYELICHAKKLIKSL